ncbi:MAG TPA: response regulator transcription factor [Nitrospiria bacterium]|jgi:DNA-binding response OmpR family regulator
MRILVIEDEKKVGNFIRQALEEERYAVDNALDGEEGQDMAEAYDYDLIVLDLMLPKKLGVTILKELRRKGNTTPILVLTAKDAVPDKVATLDSGGDDYLTKPFSIEEFLARVRVLLRRAKPGHGPLLQVADLKVDPTTREVFRGSRKIDLTNKEYALMEYLIRNPGRVLTRSMIVEHVWNIDFDTGTNVIDVYVAYLRGKIDKGEAHPLIKTIRGVGYTIKE